MDAMRCCAPSRSEGHEAPREFLQEGAAGSTEGMILVEGGSFLYGSEDALAYPADGEGPVRRVELGAVLDRRLRDHERPVRGVRRGHRLRHRGREV